MVKKYYSLTTEERSADIYIFGDITSWEWTESDVSSYSLAMELAGLDVDNINVHINSYGGEVAEALAIYNVLKRHAANVTTYVDGFACSAATIVFMAGDKRVMSKVGNFLVHPAWTHTMGNAEDLRREANDLDRITEQSITAYMEAVTKTREELVGLMAEERFLTPAEVLEWGFATEIEDEEDSERPAASVRGLVHEKLIDNGLYGSTIAPESIEEPDPEEEKEPTPEPLEEPETPTDEDNQKAQKCFFDAFKN